MGRGERGVRGLRDIGVKRGVVYGVDGNERRGRSGAGRGRGAGGRRGARPVWDSWEREKRRGVA